MKQCSKCSQVKPASEYHRDKYAKDGLVQRCKECVKVKSKEWINANRERNRITCKNNYLANPEPYKKRSKNWVQNNADLKRELDKNYQLRNPEVFRLSKQRRKARKLKNGIFDITNKEWTNIYSSNCIYCGSLKNIQADHVVPLARGGTHSLGNLVPACKTCNLSKGARTITEWKKAKRKATN